MPPSPPALTAFSRRPALGAAILLISGVFLHRTLPDAPIHYLILAASGVIAALIINRLQFFSTVALGAAILLTGTAGAQLHHFHFPHNHIAAYTTAEPRLADLELRLDQPPRTITVPARFGHGNEQRQIASAQVVRIRTHSGWADSTGAVTLSIAPPVPSLAYGQTISVFGSLHRPAPQMNPGEFDWAGYYRADRILASIHAEAPNVRILSPGTFSFVQWLRAHARSALERGFSSDRSLDHALLRALVLGDYDPQLRDVQQDFVRTGTSHHLAISGMHVAVLGAIVFFICRLARLSPRKAAITMMGFVLLYGTVALPSPPVVRSILLCLCFGIGILLRRSVDGVQLLSVTVIAMLIYSPLDLYAPGFQLSFGCVLGLMIFANPLARFIHQPSEDERVLRSFGIEPSRATGIWRWVRDALIVTFAASLVAWIISAPLIMQHFDQLNPWTVPASILLAPAVFASLVGGMLKILLTLLLPWLAPWWANLVALPVSNMRWTVGLLARIPGSDLPLPSIWNGALVLYYVLLAAPMLAISRIWLKRLLAGGAATAALAFILLPALIGFAPRTGGDLSVTLLSIGPGQCAVAQLPGGRTILIDAGSTSLQDLTRRCLAPALKKAGISRIDAVFISHADSDHFNAAAGAAKDFGPFQVYLSPYFREHARKDNGARNLLNQLDALRCPVSILKADQVLRFDDSTTLHVLWPPDNANLSVNESCLVLKLSCRGRTIHFPADAQQVAQSALLRESSWLASDVLVAPHHGSADATAAQLLDAVKPKYIIASSGPKLTGKQHEFNRLAEKTAFYRTGRSGAITIKVDKTGQLSVSEFLPTLNLHD